VPALTFSHALLFITYACILVSHWYRLRTYLLSAWSKGGNYHTSVMWWGRKEIVWRKRSCRTLLQEQENKGDQRCDGLMTWKNGLRCHLKNYWGKQRTDGDGVDLFMKWPTLGTRTVKDKTYLLAQKILKTERKGIRMSKIASEVLSGSCSVGFGLECGLSGVWNCLTSSSKRFFCSFSWRIISRDFSSCSCPTSWQI